MLTAELFVPFCRASVATILLTLLTVACVAITCLASVAITCLASVEIRLDLCMLVLVYIVRVWELV